VVFGVVEGLDVEGVVELLLEALGGVGEDAGEVWEGVQEGGVAGGVGGGGG
jgi:hypothetical protein